MRVKRPMLRTTPPLVRLMFLLIVLATSPADAAPCAPNLSQCPARGCAEAGTADAKVNTAKRAAPSGPLLHLTLDDLESLQQQASAKPGVGTNRAIANRAVLQSFTSSAGTIGEGAFVQIVGFVIGLPSRPSANKGESVNCRLTGPANNDFHIPIGRQSDDSEFEGLVVEMIPQDRPSDWTIKKLRRISKEERRVIIRGQLFYDNKHRVNDNPENDLPGQPKRFSLWEIHPVTEFFVCLRESCDVANVATEWTKLEDVQFCGTALCTP